MKRRLAIARALVNAPDLLLLDEPTTALDPQARQAIWDRLYHLKDNGVTLVLTTHHMDEAEHLCDRLVIMNMGRIVAEGSPQDLIKQYSTREVVELRFGAGSQPLVNGELSPLIQRVEVLRDRTLLYTDDADRAVAEVSRVGLGPASLLARRSTLEDVFLHITGRALGDLPDSRRRQRLAARLRVLGAPVPPELARDNRQRPVHTPGVPGGHEYRPRRPHPQPGAGG
jgi:lipooligosaccharide transport system ATP-binding protein